MDKNGQSQPDMTIHTPIDGPYQVDEKCAVFKFFLSDFWLKKSFKLR
jgi:hypothetical protein